MPKMTEVELKALLTAERNSSLGGSLASTLSSERAKALEYYNGEMVDMPAGEGQSKAVSRDVADTVEGLMPSLMEIFEGTEDIIRFDPVSQEDEPAAKQETLYVNHVYNQKNAGFMVSYTFVKDALLQKNGIVKVYWDETEKEERETYVDQDEQTFAMLAGQPDVEVTEHNDNGDGTHDVTIVKKKNYGCCRVENVPPEEFGIRKDTRSLRDCNYCFHEPPRTEADLIAQGFDEKQIKSLPTMGSREDSEGIARSTDDEESDAADTINKSTRKIKTIEHYVRMDYEDDGKPALYRVTTGGTQLEILKRDGKPDVVMVDVIPFAAMTPVIMTHRFFGKSVADLVMDIQEIKTALLRNYLTNQYLLNNQRTEIAESHAGPNTIDDLLVNRPGGIVRTKQPGGLIPIVNQPIGGEALEALGYMDSVREWRAGVTKQGQGLDPNALQNIGERAVLDAASAARAKTKLIARIFAETGFKDMFSLMHGCIRKNDKQANTVRLNNKWVQVDPRNWKTREDMTPTVGLGTGTREQEVMFLMQIMGIQEKMLMAQLPTATPKNVFNAATKIVDRLDLKSPELYFTDPESPEGQQMAQAAAQRPDPEMMKIQADKEKTMMEGQFKQQENQQKAEIEAVQAQADIATNERKLQGDMAIKQMEFQLKKELAILEFQLEERKFEREQARADQEHQQRMQMQREAHEAGMVETGASMVASREQHEQKMAQAKAKPNGGK